MKEASHTRIKNTLSFFSAIVCEMIFWRSLQCQWHLHKCSISPVYFKIILLVICILYQTRINKVQCNYIKKTLLALYQSTIFKILYILNMLLLCNSPQNFSKDCFPPCWVNRCFPAIHRRFSICQAVLFSFSFFFNMKGVKSLEKNSTHEPEPA